MIANVVSQAEPVRNSPFFFLENYHVMWFYMHTRLSMIHHSLLEG